MKNTLLPLIALLALALSPGPVHGAGKEEKWFPGDLHIHATGASWDGDKLSYPEDIKKVALERGLTWVILTDHSDATGSKDASPAYYNLGPEFTYWEKAAQLSEPGRFLMIDGNEISPLPAPPTKPGGHIGCIPINQKTFDLSGSFTDRPPGAVKAATALEECKKRGGFRVVNHAYAPAPWVEFDWTSRDYDAFEVFNGGMFFDRYDQRAITAGLCDWSMGKKTVFVGGSDVHRIYLKQGEKLSEPALGLPTTWLLSPDLTWPNLIGAMQTGRVVVGTPDTFMAFTLHDEKGTALGTMGDTLAAPKAPLTLKAHGKAPPGKAMMLKVVFAARGSCQDLREPGKNKLPRLTTTTLLSHEFTADQKEFSFSLPLTVPGPGVLHATLMPKNMISTEKSVAIANPVLFQ